jgi:carbon-monoxide dehydrogenase small subunit
MVLASCALLARNPDPTEEEIRQGLAGNLCMCTGYVQIFNALRAAAALLKQSNLTGMR